MDCMGASQARAKRKRARNLLATSGAPVTTVLVAINVIVFVAQQVSDAVINYGGFSPALGYLQPWRLLTSGFLHAGFFHLLFNMLMLYLIGSAVERALGAWRYLAVYLLSVLGGSMAIVAWVLADPASASYWTIGASGAVYGLLGSLLVLQRRSGMSSTSILVLLGINLMYGFITPGISWQAHIGGLVGGMLATGAYVALADFLRTRGGKTVAVWNFLVTVALAVAFVAGTSGLYFLVLR